jgi:hypothetical protein
MSSEYTKNLLELDDLIKIADKSAWPNIDAALGAFARDYALRNTAFIRALHIPGAKLPQADDDAIVEAEVSDDQDASVIEPDYTLEWPRNITAKAAAVPESGTVTDIGAIQVKVEGLNIDGEKIEEELPAFTANTAGSVAGSLAFKKVTKITIPIHDGTGAQTSIGFGDKLGLPDKLSLNTFLAAYVNGTKEANAPTTFAVDDDEVEKNVIDLHTALNSQDVDIYYIAG